MWIMYAPAGKGGKIACWADMACTFEFVLRFVRCDTVTVSSNLNIIIIIIKIKLLNSKYPSNSIGFEQFQEWDELGYNWCSEVTQSNVKSRLHNEIYYRDNSTKLVSLLPVDGQLLERRNRTWPMERHRCQHLGRAFGSVRSSPFRLSPDLRPPTTNHEIGTIIITTGRMMCDSPDTVQVQTRCSTRRFESEIHSKRVLQIWNESQLKS